MARVLEISGLSFLSQEIRIRPLHYQLRIYAVPIVRDVPQKRRIS